MDARNTVADLREQVRRELEGVVVGYDEPLDLLLVAAVAGGHVLIEGPPGIAKTLMAGAIARVLGVSFKRVQFTPDTTARRDHRPQRHERAARRPSSRAPPSRTSSSPTRSTARRRAPSRRCSRRCRSATSRSRAARTGSRSPFMVIATQNPYEQAGIFPLPESQLDRFLFKIHLDYASAAIERADPAAAAQGPRPGRARRRRSRCST